VGAVVGFADGKRIRLSKNAERRRLVTTENETMNKHEIKVGCDVWGWSKTLEVAIKRANKLRKHIRTDMRIKIVQAGKVVAEI
jgi:hypothetical protein